MSISHTVFTVTQANVHLRKPQGLREEEKKHVAQYEDEHLQMLSRTLAGNQREASRLQGRVEKLESENTALQQQVSTQNETLAKAVQNVSAAQVRLSSAEKAVSEHRQELARVRRVRGVEGGGTGDGGRSGSAAPRRPCPNTGRNWQG